MGIGDVSSLDFERDQRGGSTFCTNCSEIILSLSALQDVLDKTRSSIEVKLQCIRKIIVDSTTEDYLVEDDPRVCFIRTEILRGGYLKGQNEGGELDTQQTECGTETDNINMELDIKLESPNVTEEDDHLGLTEYQFGGIHEHAEVHSPTYTVLTPEDSIILPCCSSNNSRTDRKVLSVSYNDELVPDIKMKEAGSASTILKGKSAERKRKREHSPVSKTVAVSCENNIKRGRPSRIRKKSIRLICYQNDSLKIMEEKTILGNSVDSESDQQILSRFGFDKLPELRIQLENVYSEKPKVSRTVGKHKQQQRSKSKTSKTALKSSRKSNTNNQIQNFKKKSKKPVVNVVSDKVAKDESKNSQDEYEDECISSDDNYQSDSATIDSDYSETDYTKTKTVSKLKRPYGLKNNRAINIARRKRQHLKRSIILENGKRYYRHQEIVEEGDYWICAFKPCSFKMLTVKNEDESCKKMLEHFKTVHAKDNYWCKHCELFFEIRSELTKHKAEYHKKVMRECEICHKQVSIYRYEMHKWTHLNAEERAALVAAGKTDPLSKAIQTYRRKKQESKYQCAECGKRFPVLFYLTAHEKSHIDKSQRSKSICDQCGAVFSTPGGLYYHNMRVHNPEEFLSKWKVCLICDKKFLVQTHLDIHMRRNHGAEKIHNCDQCGKSFSERNSLTRHAVKHLPDPKPCKCQFCPAAYSYPNNLYRHIETSHKDKNFKRPVPKKIMNLKIPKVTNSLPVMTCLRMYPCDVCEKPFRLPCFLKKHMINSHGHKRVDKNMKMKPKETPKCRVFNSNDERTQDHFQEKPTNEKQNGSQSSEYTEDNGSDPLLQIHNVEVDSFNCFVLNDTIQGQDIVN